MAYREVTMLEVKEVLRLWLGGAAHKRIAAQLGLNVKTVRRYVAAGRASGVGRATGLEALDDGLIAAVVSRVQPHLGRPRGNGWGDCTAQRAVIERFLRQGVRLSKLRKLLRRQGVEVSYATLRRFAIAELGFGGTAPTIPVADCGPGEEVQLDTGWMTHLAPDASGRRRRFRAWIFTAVLSRYRFVYPVFRETTETAIEACEAAWAFFHGVFRVLIPDNTKAIVQRADPLEPRLNPAFLEYAQARGFVIDPTRVRRAGTKPAWNAPSPASGTIASPGRSWPTSSTRGPMPGTGARRSTGRGVTVAPCARPANTSRRSSSRPCAPPPRRCTTSRSGRPKVARDQHAQVARALYSLPTQYVGQTLRARADRTTVRFYAGAVCVKVHPRMPPGGRAFDRQDSRPRRPPMPCGTSRAWRGGPRSTDPPSVSSPGPSWPGISRGRGCARSTPSSASRAAMVTPA